MNLFWNSPIIDQGKLSVMIRYHALNGQLTEAALTSLHVSDLAILRGYGIFDFFLVREGRPLFIEDYLDRFLRSAELMELDLPVSRERLHETILQVIAANSLWKGAIRLLATGGYAEDSFTPVSPNWLVLAHPYKDYGDDAYVNGVKLLLHQFQRELPQAKSINYARAIRLQKEIREAGAFEALYHNGAEVLESFRSNVFFVFDGPVLATPSENILLGITRKHVLKMAPAILPTEVHRIGVEEVGKAREAFLTGSNKAILPVVQIGDQVIGDGKVGPVTRQLMGMWETYVGNYVYR